MRGQDPLHQCSSWVSARAAGARCLRFDLPLPVGGARDAVRVLEERHDQRGAAEQQRPVARDPEPLLERVRQQRLDRDEAGEDRARDHRDAADVGEGDQAERGQRGEAADRDRAEVVAVQRAGDPGDEGGDSEGGELDVADVDPGGRRGALVRADGEHALPEVGAAQVRDQQPERERDRDDEEAEHRARHLAVERRGTGRTGRGRGRRSSAPAPASSSCRRPRSCSGRRTARSRPRPRA